MKISLLVPWRDDHGWRSANWRWVCRRWELLFPNFEICMGEQSDTPHFNRSEAINRAYRKASGDIFVIIDVDVIHNPYALMQALKLVEEDNNRWFFPFKRYYNLNESASVAIRNLPPDSYIPEPTDWDVLSVQTESGCAVIHRSLYERVGGFDSGFEAWGPEDQAFTLACEILEGSRNERINDFAVHLWHPSSSENWWKITPSVLAHRRWENYKALSGKPEELRAFKGSSL